jgi:anti-sigma regulatory factor (Ser/Thr protein kinase)
VTPPHDPSPGAPGPLVSLAPPPMPVPGIDARLEARDLLQVLLRCDLSAPRLARQALSTLGMIDRVRDDVTLVASELVTNAVLHSGCDSSEEIELLVQIEPTLVRLVITDPGRCTTTPTLAGAEHRPYGGMGLRIVEALAQRWGSEQLAGTAVWAELSLACA